MGNQKGMLPVKLLLILVLIVVIGIGGYLFIRSRSSTSSVTSVTPTTTTPSPSISPETSLLVDAAVWYPSAPWSEPSSATEQTAMGNLTGESISATVTSPTASIPHFEMASQLEAKGFTPDINLAADGPGSSMWGYSKTENGMTQIMLFSYKAQPTNSNPNEPLQFDCPCKVNVNVFVSNPFPTKSN